MDTKWRPQMMSAISEVLETMFFESVDFEGGDAATGAWYCESSIRFSRDGESREIVLRLAEPFARLITANFLGTGEGGMSSEEMADALRELTNMVGGNYLGRLKNEDWKLGIPECRMITDPVEELPSGLPILYMGECVGVVALRSST